MTKSKISLHLLGINNDHPPIFFQLSNLIKDNEYIVVTNKDQIPHTINELIEEYYNKEIKRLDTTNWKRIDKIFAFEGDKWNGSCQPTNALPNKRFEYLYYADETLIICSTSGGFAVSPWHEFYEINDDRLEFIGEINTLSKGMFNLSLMLKFDNDLVDWSAIETNSILK